MVSSNSAILASGTLSPMMLPSNCSAASMVVLLAAIAADCLGWRRVTLLGPEA